MKIEESPKLSKFLEDGLRMIYEHGATRVALFATLEDDDILCGYHNCNIPTKILYAGYMQQDAMIDTLNSQSSENPDEEDTTTN